MVNSTLFTVSASEADLIEAMSQVRYGEIFGIDLPRDEGNFIDWDELPQATKDLLLYIRSGQRVDVLTVHNGLPTAAETDSKMFGFRCRKRVRFPSS